MKLRAPKPISKAELDLGMQLARSLAERVKSGDMKREDAVKQLGQAGNPMARTTLKWLGA